MQKGVVRKRRSRQVSEYGRQLKEKQDLRGQYNLRERQFRRYVKEALREGRAKGDAVERFLQRLERRLDNVVYRAGIAKTRPEARQMVSHGHFLVEGRPVTIPSLQVAKRMKIALHPSSAASPLFEAAKLSLKNHEAPAWLFVDKENLEITVQRDPSSQEAMPTVEIPLIFEYYSR